MIAPGLGIEPDKLRIIQNPTGGTFGYKFSPTMEALLGVACLATGKPVSLIYNQFQNITYTGKRSPGDVKFKLGADKDGKLLAMETDWWIDHGPYSEFGDLLTVRQAQFIGAGYDIPNIRGTGHTVCTNHAWGSAFRAYGSPQAFLASETAMDMLAEKMGMDPFELRYKNLYRARRHHADRPGPRRLLPARGCSTCCARSTRRPRSAARNSPPPRRSAASASRWASTAAAWTARTAPRRRSS